MAFRCVYCALQRIFAVPEEDTVSSKEIGQWAHLVRKATLVFLHAGKLNILCRRGLQDGAAGADHAGELAVRL